MVIARYIVVTVLGISVPRIFASFNQIFSLIQLDIKLRGCNLSAKTVRFAIIGSTGAIGSTQISAISHVDCAQLVGIHARTKSKLLSQAKTLGVKPFVD